MVICIRQIFHERHIKVPSGSDYKQTPEQVLQRTPRASGVPRHVMLVKALKSMLKTLHFPRTPVTYRIPVYVQHVKSSRHVAEDFKHSQSLISPPGGLKNGPMVYYNQSEGTAACCPTKPNNLSVLAMNIMVRSESVLRPMSRLTASSAP
jgi:hypothetical protein